MSQWFYLWFDGRVHGPVTASELRRQEASLGPNAKVWNINTGWQPVWTAFSSPESADEELPDPTSAPPSPPLPPEELPPASAPTHVATDDAPGVPATARSPSSQVGRPGLLLIAAVALLVFGGLVALGVSAMRSPSSTQPAAASPSPTYKNESTEGGPGDEGGSSGPLASGDWVGAMDSGRYTFEMSVDEDVGGNLSARMTQNDTQSGESGTEYLSGRRTGDRLVLKGFEWSADTPPSWSLDTIRAQIFETPQTRKFSGTYTCGACGGARPIQGRSVPD